jgi:hypothetical protein
MGFTRSALSITGETLAFTSLSARGSDAVRNSCKACGGLVFGGAWGKDDAHTLYAGSLDDPSAFTPRIAIFTDGRPAWALIPEGLTVFQGGPG